jgi:hypothetical protein
LSHGTYRSLVASRFGLDYRALMQDMIQVLPKEEKADDVVPALDDILVVVDGHQVAAAEGKNRFQYTASRRFSTYFADSHTSMKMPAHSASFLVLKS